MSQPQCIPERQESPSVRCLNAEAFLKAALEICHSAHGRFYVKRATSERQCLSERLPPELPTVPLNLSPGISLAVFGRFAK